MNERLYSFFGIVGPIVSYVLSAVSIARALAGMSLIVYSAMRIYLGKDKADESPFRARKR